MRGKGLLIGIRLEAPNTRVHAAARDARLLIAGGGDNCVRLLPPLTADGEASEAIDERAATRLEAARRGAQWPR